MDGVNKSVQHKAVIVSDEPINLVNVVDAGGRWFRVLCCLVDSGAWARMNDSAKGVYVVLAKHCAAGRWLAWPGIKRIRELSGVSRAQVYRAINELEGEGLLRRRTRGGGRGLATTYELLDLPASPSLPFLSPGKGCKGLHSKGSHGCDGKGLMGETPTRVHELDNSNRTKKGTDNGVSVAPENAAAVKRLAEIGVENPAAVVERYGGAACLAALAWSKGKRGIRNVPGLLLAGLQRGLVKAGGRKEITAESISESLRVAREASDRAAAEFYGKKWAEVSVREKGGL